MIHWQWRAPPCCQTAALLFESGPQLLPKIIFSSFCWTASWLPVGPGFGDTSPLLAAAAAAAQIQTYAHRVRAKLDLIFFFSLSLCVSPDAAQSSVVRKQRSACLYRAGNTLTDCEIIQLQAVIHPYGSQNSWSAPAMGFLWSTHADFIIVSVILVDLLK